MKKVLSLVLVVALFASLCVFASADVVPHAHNEEFSIIGDLDLILDPDYSVADGDYPVIAYGCEVLNEAYNTATQPWMQEFVVTWAQGQVRWSAQQVKVLDITEGAKQTWTTEAQAITAAELQAVVDADERINNLTVFRQRNIEEAEGAVDISVKLWPCAPDKHEDHATVVLFRAEGTEEWTVVGYAADKVCDATLSGNGAYVVALAW